MNLKNRNGSFLAWLAGTGVLLFLSLLIGLWLLFPLKRLDGSGVKGGLYLILLLDLIGLAGTLYELIICRKKNRKTQERLHQIFSCLLYTS